MKKKICFILLSLFLILLVGCSNRYDISKILFIASIGIEKKEDSLEGYFYLPLSSDIGKTENTENKGQGEYAKTSGKTISELFYNLQTSTSLIINYRHVSSIVLNQELLNQDFIVELLDYVKYSFEIDFNCYIFVTKEKMNELFDFKNPNQESVLNSMLVSTSDASDLFLVAPPIHFLEFTQRFYNHRNIILPMLDLEEIWTIEGEASKNFHAQSAIYYYQDSVKEVIKNPSSPYFSKVSLFIDHLDKTTISYKNYKMKEEFKEDALYLNVEFSYDIYQTENQPTPKEIEAFVSKRIQDYLDEFQQIDPLDLNYYNQVYKTKCNYENIKINIHFKKN